MITNIILAVVLTIALIVAGLLAGAETGVYQLSRLRLRIGVEKKRWSFVMLTKLMKNSSALLISMLIGNNLTHYAVTGVVTYMLFAKLQSEHSVELFATIITAPILFVFCELIPKTAFFYRADTLMPMVAPLLLVFHKIFMWCKIVPLLKTISSFFAKLTGSTNYSAVPLTTGRTSHIETIIRDTHEEQLLSTVQRDIINRVARISNVSIKFVMTPLAKTQTVNVKTDKAELLRKLKRSVFTRLPVYKTDTADIAGFVNIYDCLNYSEDFEQLDDFLQPIRKLDANTNVSNAIDVMQRENQKIVVVTRTSHTNPEKPIGILTMKDLVEELVGELREW